MVVFLGVQQQISVLNRAALEFVSKINVEPVELKLVRRRLVYECIHRKTSLVCYYLIVTN